jgi:tetratricopeptide (TPR) repeat protein
MTAARRQIIMLAIVATVCGCQSVQPARKAMDDVSTVRRQRKAEVVESFESKRTFAQLEAARSRLQLGDVEGCNEAAQSVLQRDPDNAEALALLYEMKKTSGRSAENAAVAQTSFVAAVPDTIGRITPAAAGFATRGASDDRADFAGQPADSFAQRWLRKASAALDVANVSEARHCMQQALAAEPDSRQLAVSAAVLSLRYNQPDLALELAQSALPRFNDDAALHRIIGLAQYRRGDLASSQLALQQALSLDNGHPLTYFLLGHTMQKLGAADTAEWCFAQARRTNPTEAAP